MNEKLVKYFAGEMSSSEKEEFEKIINSSPSLQDEAARYHKFFSGIAETSKPEADESYFINLIPSFRDKLAQGKKKKYRPVISFATAALTVIILFLFIPHSGQVIHNENPTVNYSSSDISDYLMINSEQPLVANLPTDVEVNYDSLLDGMIYDELSNGDQNLAGSELVDKLDYNTLLESVNQNDASAIYEQLKNKIFF